MKNLWSSALAIAISLMTTDAWAGPGKVHPKPPSDNNGQLFTQLLDNHIMRLWEIELTPGQFADVHGHPGQKAYAATDGILQVTTSEGKIEEIKVRAGDLLWTDVTKYRTVNMGTQPFNAVVYEEKSEQIQSPKNFYSFFSEK